MRRPVEVTEPETDGNTRLAGAEAPRRGCRPAAWSQDERGGRQPQSPMLAVRGAPREARAGPSPPLGNARRRPAARLPLAGPSCHRGRMFRHFFLAPRARGLRRKATVLGRKVRSARLSIDSEKENKKKTNMLATEGPFHSAESVLRRFNLRFTHVALSVFTGGHRGGSLEGSAARAESSWQGLQVPQQ